MSTLSAGTPGADVSSIMATVVFHSSGVCPCEFVMLVKLWHAEQASVTSCLASPSGNWTAARSCICSCPRAGKAKSREPAMVQIKSDLMDIVPPSSFPHTYLRRRIPPLRYKKLSSWRGQGSPSGPQHHAHSTTNPIGAQTKPNCERNQRSREREFWMK